ncbi:MAG: endonuclease III [bacterium]
MASKNMIDKIISILQKNTKKFTPPLAQTIIKEYGKKPFLILISGILSPRVKDSTTLVVCKELFKIAKTPKQILKIPVKNLEKIIYKIGFYKNKAKALHNASKIIVENFNGRVPKTQKELLTIPGVGVKVANLVLGIAFGKPEICVDVHVDRISNRLGIIKTKNVIETEKELAKILPKKNWTKWNKLLVMWGQNICTPRNPKCSICKLNKICKKVGVKSHR